METGGKRTRRREGGERGRGLCTITTQTNSGSRSRSDIRKLFFVQMGDKELGRHFIYDIEEELYHFFRPIWAGKGVRFFLFPSWWNGSSALIPYVVQGMGLQDGKEREKIFTEKLAPSF